MVKIDSGTCETRGFKTITLPTDCELYGTLLDSITVFDITDKDTNHSNIAYGCYFDYASSKLRLNTNENSTVECSNNIPCICLTEEPIIEGHVVEWVDTTDVETSNYIKMFYSI